MKLLVKILALIFALAAAALGIALLKQEHTPSYISVYDTDDDLFWFTHISAIFTASPPFMEGFPFIIKDLGQAVFYFQFYWCKILQIVISEVVYLVTRFSKKAL